MDDANFSITKGLIGLLPLFVYVVCIFKYKKPIPCTILAVVLGAVITHQTIFTFSTDLVKSLGSLLGFVGLLIMMGRGLGEILTKTKVTHVVVQKIVNGIGVNTENRAMASIMIASAAIVTLLGTVAGGNAVIAPIVLPIAAAAGLTKSTVGVIFHTSGEEGMILGPFSPSLVIIMELTHLSYLQLIFQCALPLIIVTGMTTWFVAKHIQKKTKGINDYEAAVQMQNFVPTAIEKRTAVIFAVSFMLLVGYGIIMNANTHYIVTVVALLAIVTGLAGKMTISEITTTFLKGMSANVSFFVLFILLDPFINYMAQSGAFKAIMILLEPLVNYGGRISIPIIAGVTGAVGLSGATVAVVKVTYDLFINLVTANNIPVLAWAAALLVANRATSYIHPGPNLFSSMGLAQSEDIVSMLKNGWITGFVQIIFLFVYAYFIV